MSVGTWQRRLEETFRLEREAHQPIWWVAEQESDFARQVEDHLAGHVALLDAWHAFFAATLHVSLSSMPSEGDTTTYWGAVISEYLTAFRDFRAAELVFRSGYPLAGYRILRDLKDRAVFMAAIAAGHSSWSALHGLPSQNETADEVRKAMVKEERRVLELMIRTESGLSESTLEWLRRWEALFHREVHGATLTWAAMLGPWVKGEPLTLGPKLEERAGSAYTNRACEVSWMWLRLLPYLQLAPEAYGQAWSRKWRILDESFDFMESDLRDIGKHEIVDAVLELMREKFPFDPTCAYVDRKPQ